MSVGVITATSFVGNLTGTASYADSASQALTASYVNIVFPNPVHVVP
jgi:hypothetical protein